jgi:hypothetical protein
MSARAGSLALNSISTARTGAVILMIITSLSLVGAVI